MIHYHGTPIGGTRIDVIRFITGRHALIPFGRHDDLGAVMEASQSFILDNGAFSHWKKGCGRIDFDAYFSWAKSLHRHPGFDWCLIPDVIDGTEIENQNLVIKWARIGSRVKGIPVWHLHESLEYLESLVSEWEIIAIGSSGKWANPGTGPWWKRIDEAMRVICDDSNRPKCKIHGLRMLNPEIFTKLPLSSADSTNAAVNCGSLSRFGMYQPPTASQRAEVIAERIEQHNSSSIYLKSHTNIDLFEAIA